jgi:hypothetical protein
MFLSRWLCDGFNASIIGLGQVMQGAISLLFRLVRAINMNYHVCF